MNDLQPQDYYNCYYGGKHITNDKRYLRKVVNELPEEYNNRQRFATYPNFQSKIIDIIQGYVHFHKATIEDSDLDLEDLSRKTVKHSSIAGIAYILTLPIGPKVYPCTNVKPTISDGVCIGYEFNGRDGQISVDLESKKVTQQIKGKEEQILQYYPDMVVEVRWNEKGESLIRDTAPLNILIYNLQSILDSLASMMQLVYPYGPPIGEDKRPQQGTYIPVNQGEQVPGFAQPNMSQIEILRKEIDIRIMQMGRMVGLESEFSEETTVQSGIAKAYQMIDTTAVVAQIAREASNSINRAALCWSNMTGKKGGSISLNPIMHPDIKNEAIREIQSLLAIVKTEEIIKWAQQKAFLSIASNENQAEKQRLIEDIKKNGGAAAMDLGYDLMME